MLMPPAAPRPPHVLIVEDDPNVMSMLVAQLERRVPRATFVGASNVQEGRAELDREPVDLILSDYHLPDGNGLDFLRQAKREYPATRRVMLTGAPEEGLALDAARDAGIERFFVKPIDMPALARVIERMLAK